MFHFWIHLLSLRLQLFRASLEFISGIFSKSPSTDYCDDFSTTSGWHPVDLLTGSCPHWELSFVRWLTDGQKRQQISALTQHKKVCTSFNFCSSCSVEKEFQFLETTVWHLLYTSYTLQRCTYVNSDFDLTSTVSMIHDGQFKASIAERQENVLAFLKLITDLSCSEWSLYITGCRHPSLAEETLLCLLDRSVTRSWFYHVIQCQILLLFFCYKYKRIPLEQRQVY